MTSFFNQWLASWSLRNRQLTRIADALDRIAPLPEPTTDVKPEDAVTYVDEEVMAQQDEAEEIGELARYMQEHSEDLIPPSNV
jgi:beta-lactamase class A